MSEIKHLPKKQWRSRSPGDVILGCIWNMLVLKQWCVRGLKQKRILERQAAGMVEPEFGN